MAARIQGSLFPLPRPANNFKAAQRQKANEIFISLAFFVANRSPEGTYTNREVLLSGHPVSGGDLRPSRGRGAGFFDKKSKSGLRSVDLFSFFCIMLSEGVENMPERLGSAWPLQCGSRQGGIVFWAASLSVGFGGRFSDCWKINRCSQTKERIFSIWMPFFVCLYFYPILTALQAGRKWKNVWE